MKSALVLLAIAVAAMVNVVSGCTTTTVDVSNSTGFVAALFAAKPGTTILLAKGTYSLDNQQFLVNVSGQSDCPIIIDSAVPMKATIMSPITVTANNIIFQNVVIATSDAVGVVFNSCKNNEMINVSMYGQSETGIYFQDATSITVHNCSFEKMGSVALRTQGSSYIHVEYCSFGNGIVDNAVVLDYRSSYIYIEYNSFYGNGYTGDSPSWIVVNSDTTHSSVQHNVFMNSVHRKMAYGIACLGGSDNQFNANFVVMNSASSIAFYTSNTQQKVCASNKVFGCRLTNGPIDTAC